MRTTMKCPFLPRPLSAVSAGWLLLTATAPGQTPYDFGNPTAEEQLYMEFINRARANPPAEGARLAATTDPNVLSAISQYGVNLALMQSEFNAIPVAPPLASHASLLAAARSHSAWMLANDVQDHYESTPYNTPWGRITAAGYTYSTMGENIFAHAASVWHGHAGFQIDWGYGTGGMQSPRGHRDSIHNPAFREVGIGVVLGSNENVGPQLVTQDFGSRFSSPNLGTGVAYYDLNGNHFYDLGEGIGGLTVTVSGVTAYCLTAVGGGWVVPCPTTAANRTVTFSGLNVNQNVPIVFPANANAKADLKLAYSPPAITSPAIAVAGSPHNLSFAAVGGATGYTWSRSTAAAAPAENCESTAGITTSTSGGYAVLNTAVKQQGTASFHLANPGTSQSFQLNSLFHAGSSPSLYFQSLVRYSTSDERFKVQVKQEGTAIWQDVYSQTGYNGSGEAAFSLRWASLGAMAGSSFRVRFILDYSSGSLYGLTDNDFGWFIDAISFSGVSVLGGTVTESLAGTSGSFTPAAGSYLMGVAPVISGHDFPAAYQTLTVIQPAPFASWAAGYAAAYSLPAGTLADPAGDYDKDGRIHLIEYAFGTSPVLASEPTPRLPVAELTATHLVLRYQRDSSLTDLTLTPQASATLGAWKAPGEAGAPAGFTDTLVATAGNLQTREAKVPRSSGAKIFMRVNVSMP
jgi:hypothetical protein